MYYDDTIKHVMISFEDVPPRGTAKLLVLMDDKNRDIITDAARVVGMSQQKFMRAVLVSAAHKVLKEAGIQVV